MDKSKLLNTLSCWQVDGKMTLYFHGGKKWSIEDGTAKQTPSLFDLDCVRIVDRSVRPMRIKIIRCDSLDRIEDEHGQSFFGS